MELAPDATVNGKRVSPEEHAEVAHALNNINKLFEKNAKNWASVVTPTGILEGTPEFLAMMTGQQTGTRVDPPATPDTATDADNAK